MMKTCSKLSLIILLLLVSFAQAQQHWKKKTGFVLEYGNVRAWPGLVDLVPPARQPVYLFDDNIYHGHANFVLRNLKRKVTFTSFKELVKYPEKRQYIPFNLYDLREKDFSYSGTKYTWAIKMCDYVLQDNPEQMAEFIARTYRYVQAYLKSVDANCGEGVMLLSNSETATPNYLSLEAVKEAGIPVCTLKEFYNGISYHPNSTSVMNEGAADGIVQFIKSGEEDQAVSNEHFIYVFERTPERVPLAKAFVTLQPQTYLSHINLLAINRRTPNVSTSDKELIAELKALHGKAVRLNCSKENNEVHLKLLNQFVPSPEKSRSTKLNASDNTTTGIIDLDDSTKNTLMVVGAKAANYAILQKYFPDYVKKGAAIPFHYYHQLIAEKKISVLIDAYVSLPDTAGVKRISLQRQIRDAITSSHLPSELLVSLKAMQMKKFNGKKIRIRSSTNCEDLPEFNGAGLYLSKGIKANESLDEMKKKLLQVYASMWNDNACSERRFFGIDHREAAMAILINEAYENEWANGVALIMPGDSGKNQLVINSQPGEHEVTNPQSGDVPEELFFTDASVSRFNVTSRSNYGKVLIGVALTKKLADELRVLCVEIDKILKQGLTNEAAADFGTDIEFKIILQNGKARLWVKQARLLNIGSAR